MSRAKPCTHGFVALNPETLSRRLVAARALAGLSQKELGVLMKRDGYGSDDPSRIERAGQPNPPRKPPPVLHQGRADSVAKHTGVPLDWFFEPDLSKLFATPEASSLQRDVDRLDRHLRELETVLVEAELLDAEAIDRILDSLDTNAPPQGEVPAEDEGLQRG